MNALIILAERCVHQAVANASCDVCVGACPRSAWKINADGLSFDNAACDSCGLCVAACPSEALALPQITPMLRNSHAGKDVLIACEYADSTERPLSRQSGIAEQTSLNQKPGVARVGRMEDSKLQVKAGITPCLHALTPHWVFHWAGQHAGSRVRYSSGDCQQCARGGGLSWPVRFAAVAEGLHASGHSVPLLQKITFQSWQQAVAQQAEPDNGRRGLFRAMLRPPSRAAALAPSPTMTSARTSLLKMLRDQGVGRALWAVALDQERCTWCMACVQLCNTSAIRFASDLQLSKGSDQKLRMPRGLREAAGRFTLDMQRCTGCGVCVDACDHAALRNVAVQVSNQPVTRHIELRHANCSQCKVGFHHVAITTTARSRTSGNSVTPDESMICPACRQGRPKQYDRWVQTEEGA